MGYLTTINLGLTTLMILYYKYILKGDIMKAFLLVCLVFGGNMIAEDSIWDKIKDTTSSAWDTTKEKVNSINKDDIKEKVKDGYETTKETIKSVDKDSVQSGYNKTKKFVDKKTAPSIWDKVKDTSNKVWDTTKEYSQKAWKTSKETYQKISTKKGKDE